MSVPWRAIQPSIRASKSLAEISREAESLYFRMLVQTDAWGLLAGAPPKVRADCAPLVPWTDSDIAALLEEIVRAGRLDLYCEDGVWVARIVDFEANQPYEVWRVQSFGNRQSRWPRRSEKSCTDATAHDLFHAREGGRARGSATVKGSVVQESLLVLETPGIGGGLGEERRPSIDPVREVYEHWRTARGKTHGRYDAISQKRREKIVARLREFTVDELNSAIDAVALDPWEERARHDDLLIILRSREQVERFLSFAENPEILRRASARRGVTAADVFDQAGVRR